MPAGKKSPHRKSPQRVAAGKKAARTRKRNARMSPAGRKGAKSPRKSCRTVTVRKTVMTPRKVTRTVMAPRTVTSKRKVCSSPRKSRVICRRSPRRSTNIRGRRVLKDNDPILQQDLSTVGDIIRTQESVEGRKIYFHTPVQYLQKTRLRTEGSVIPRNVMTSISYDARDDVHVILPYESSYYRGVKRAGNDVHLRLVDNAALGVRIAGIKGAKLAINGQMTDVTIRGDTLRAYLTAVHRAYAENPTVFGRGPYLTPAFTIAEKNRLVETSTFN